jgi:hypothetical protein
MCRQRAPRRLKPSWNHLNLEIRMAFLIALLRLIHIVAGILWVGFAAFLPFYLVPALAETGPEAGKIMGALQRRGLMTALPALAGLNMLAGLGLFWAVSSGSAEYFRTPMSHTLILGALFAIAAFVLGMRVARPSMLRADAIMQSLSPAALPEERARTLADAEKLRQRGSRAAGWAAGLLILASACMAVARYV